MSAATPNLETPASRGPGAGRRPLDPRGAIVRAIRWLDRRGGLSSTRGERAYSRSARHETVDRTVLEERILGLRPYALITIRKPDTSEEDPS